MKYPKTPPDIGENKRKRARVIETHPQGTPKQDCSSSKDFCYTTYYGHSGLSGLDNVPVNREDGSRDLNCGGPIILNKGESIFTCFPRRTTEGSTIRCEQEQDVPRARTQAIKLKVKG